MYLVAVLTFFLIQPTLAADWWDDFTNNLATDLAPFIALLGERPAQQFLSESTSIWDYAIYAMAPLGIVTTIVSAIRVGGGPSLRAFIGRAQEGQRQVEAELYSSTSADMCEMYNNGGISRVFGKPKILEIVVGPSTGDFEDRGEIQLPESTADWSSDRIPVRDTARRLTSAIAEMTNIIFSDDFELHGLWGYALSLRWPISCLIPEDSREEEAGPILFMLPYGDLILELRGPWIRRRWRQYLAFGFGP